MSNSNNMNVLGSERQAITDNSNHTVDSSGRSSNMKGVSEDEADALQLYEMLQDENGIVSASKLNQLVKQYFALETEFASRGRVGGGVGGVATPTTKKPPLIPLSATNSFSFMSAAGGSTSLNAATLPGPGALSGSRPSTSQHLAKGVSQRHTTSASERRPPASRVSSAVALPSSQATATMAKELSGPQLLSFLLTTRYALAAGVRRTRRQANLEHQNAPSSLGDYLTGGDIQTSIKRRMERDVEGTRRDVRAMIFAQKKIEIEHQNGTNIKHNRVDVDASSKKPLLPSKNPYSDIVPPTVLMRFCDVFANTDISDEDELINDSETGFLSELYTGQGPTLVAAPHARVLPPLFPGVTAESRQRRRRHLQSTFSGGGGGALNQYMPGDGGRSSSSTVDFKFTRRGGGDEGSDEEDDDDDESSENSTDMDAVNTATGNYGGNYFLNSNRSDALLLNPPSSTVNRKSKKYARRKSQIDASVMKLFIAELELEFNELVEEFESSGGGGRRGGGDQQNHQTTAATTTKTLESDLKAGGGGRRSILASMVDRRGGGGGGGVDFSKKDDHRELIKVAPSGGSRRSSTEPPFPAFSSQNVPSLDHGLSLPRVRRSSIPFANSMLAGSATTPTHTSLTSAATGKRITSPSHPSSSISPKNSGSATGGGRLLSPPIISSSRRGSGDGTADAAIPLGSMSMANSSRRPYFDGGGVVSNAINKSIVSAASRSTSRVYPEVAGGGLLGGSSMDPSTTASPNHKKVSTERRLKLLALEVKHIGSALLLSEDPHDDDLTSSTAHYRQPPRGGEKRLSVGGESSSSGQFNPHHHDNTNEEDTVPPSGHNTGDLTGRMMTKGAGGRGGLSGVILSQLFPNRHHMQHTLQEVEDAIDNEEASPHGWQDQRRKPKSTVLFVGRSKLPRMAQHGIVLVDKRHQDNNSPTSHHASTLLTPTTNAPTTTLTLRRGGGINDPSKHKYLTPLQDRTTPLNRDLPAWKKAWKLLSQNVSAHGTGRKFNLASTQRLARDVKGTGLQNLSGQRPYHLSADEKQAILQQVINQRAQERVAAAEAASMSHILDTEALRGGKLRRGPSPKRKINRHEAKGGAELKASANMALAVLQSWRNHRSLQQPSSPPRHEQHYTHPPQRMAEASPPSQSERGGYTTFV